MTQQASGSRHVQPWRVMLIVLVVLVLGAQWAGAQTPGIDYEQGDMACIGDYLDAQCTANDLGLHSAVPTVLDICESDSDTVSIQFLVTFEAASADRYDLAIFIATDGGSANDGDLWPKQNPRPTATCYHDFLQEAAVYNANPDLEIVDLTSGYGPFHNLDQDACADMVGNTLASYYTQAPVTIRCQDINITDGMIDPLSMCTAYDNNDNTVCSDVTTAVPGTGSKCGCIDHPLSPGIIVYRGLDYGDLPDSYGTLAGSDGARHAVQDPGNDNAPDTIVDTVSEPDITYPAVWLGPIVDYAPNAETDGYPSPDALGDDENRQNGNRVDDEDGVSTNPVWYRNSATGGSFDVTVSTSTGDCAGCQLGYWVDLNGDGDFADANEANQAPVTAGTQTVYVNTTGVTLPSGIYARFRLYDANYSGAILPTGLVGNGEVEDYWFDITPTAVTLASFRATGTTENIVLNWETVSEIDNLGFNLYRATALHGGRIRINPDLIPSQAPGTATGAEYEYVDASVSEGVDYYYWLEMVDTHGGTALTDPALARVGPLARVFLPLVVH